MLYAQSYFNSIRNLPIERFALISETSDLRWLMFDPDEFTPKVNLDEVYLRILEEYRAETKQDESSSLGFSIQRQMLQIAIKYDCIKMACFVLELDPCNDEAIKILRNAGYTITNDRCELEQVFEILHRASNYRTKLEEKRIELDRFNEVESKKEQRSQSFVDYVAELAMQLGRDIDYKNMTVREWIAFERALIKNQENRAKNG